MPSFQKSLLLFLSLLDLFFNALLLVLMLSNLAAKGATHAALFAVMLLLSGAQIAYAHKTFQSSQKQHPLLQALSLNLFINLGFVVFVLAENSARS
ncbi:hypothetical protein EON83_24135 [bacterium]|nr:MAG: hypothetical protein EON83_24135 [bacterium]